MPNEDENQEFDQTQNQEGEEQDEMNTGEDNGGGDDVVQDSTDGAAQTASAAHANTQAGAGGDEVGSEKSRTLLGVAIVAVVVVVVGVVVWLAFGSSSPSLGVSGNAVATVNGETITKNEFQDRYDQLTQSLGQQADQVSDARIQQQALQSLVTEEILAQYADKNGIEVSDQEIQARIDQLTQQSGGEEQFKERLSQQNISMEDVRTSVDQQLTRQAIAEDQGTSTGTVSDEEARARYDQMTANAGQNAQIPPFEQVKAALKQQLEQQKQQQVLTSLSQELREEYDVEVLLDIEQPAPAPQGTGQAPQGGQATGGTQS